uniref:HSF-type DNA-binding domain-containing protein n=1 Tax=Panagrolaimus sp. JU765 TaxID=591449 RepID=A0AC34Q3Z4_9BILA
TIADGFRKMTPIERTSLARAESDQDHLEFSHPCFVRDHPELLTQIKRKTPHNKKEEVVPANKDLSGVLDEIRLLRDRQSGMEERMNELVNENISLWQQMDSMRATHVKQQQIVNKLVQFLVTLVQPKRLGKRHLLAIDEASSPKQRRPNQSESSTALQSIHNHNVNDILDNLMREISTKRDYTPLGSNSSGSGP